jgi:predicted nucleic acid-binding protein
MRSDTTRPSLSSSWTRLAGAGLLAAIAVTGCSASPASSPGLSGNGNPSSPAAGTSATPAATPAAALTPSASPSPARSAEVRNLLVSQAVRRELTAAYETHMHFSAADVSGTAPGSVYYAFDQSTNSYWAMARFVPAKTASLNVQVSFQDGASEGLFTKARPGSWQAHSGGTACVLTQFFPAAVLAAWALPTTYAALSC